MITYRAFLAIVFLVSSFQYIQPTQNDWDLLIFTQKWPTTVCNEWKQKNHAHKCSMPSNPNTWGIHGIWPTKYHTLGPFFCNRTWHFDPEVIKPIEDQMNENWRNIESGTDHYSLWVHEWTKHGTCAAVLEPLNSELKYFSKGLELLEEFNMTNILSDAAIVPSNSNGYRVEEISAAVKVHLGINAVVECRKESGKNNIMEIRICFDKNLKLMDCDGVVTLLGITKYEGDSVLTNCNRDEPVSYPAFNELPNTLIVQLYKLVSWLQWFTL